MTILGVDIGGTNIDVVVLEQGDFNHIATYPTPQYIHKLDEMLKELIEQFNVSAVGFGIAAWIRKNKIIKTPNLPKVSLKFDLNVPIILENDANCFTFYFANKFNYNNVIGITIGTGVGSGIVMDGKIIRGLGLAGEIGHWFVGGEARCTCGGRGHLESYFGGWSIREQFGKDAIELFKNNEIYKIEGFKKLCIAVANAIALLDPEAVVFGGRIGGNMDRDVLKKEIYKYLMDEFRPEILTLKDPLAVAKGACLLAKSLVAFE